MGNRKTALVSAICILALAACAKPTPVLSTSTTTSQATAPIATTTAAPTVAPSTTTTVPRYLVPAAMVFVFRVGVPDPIFQCLTSEFHESDYVAASTGSVAVRCVPDVPGKLDRLYQLTSLGDLSVFGGFAPGTTWDSSAHRFIVPLR